MLKVEDPSMRRYIKILLALLYLLQLPIIFRESVLELYRSASDSLHRESQTVQAPGPTLLKRGPVHGALPEQVLEQRDSLLDPFVLLGFAVIEHGDHHHLPEHQQPDRPKREDISTRKERFIANLFERIRRLAPPAERTEGANGMQRLILFGAEA